MLRLKREKNRHYTSSRNSSRNSLRPPFWIASAWSWVVFALGIAGPLAAQGAFVRVNQIGYPMNATKRAYLMSSTAGTGGTFNVLNSLGIGAKLGSWGSFANVYALDFDAVTTSGTYTIAVQGPVAATSPRFAIDLAANLYAVPLANSLYFYQNERDGANFIGTQLRTAGGHLKDSVASVYLTPNVNKNGRFSGDLSPTGAHIDASGGWWDAGDYLKFVQTELYGCLDACGCKRFSESNGRRIE